MDEETQSPEQTASTDDSAWYSSRRNSGNSITLKLDNDGNIKPLSDRMQQRLREFASKDDWQAATGLDSKSDSNAVTDKDTSSTLELLDEAKAKEILKWLEQTKQMMWGIVGLSEAKRTEICHYSEAQKDLLAPPIATVVNKRSPDWMRKYWPEIQLALFLGTIEIGQFQACGKALMEEKRTKQNRPHIVPPQQIREREPRTEERKEPVASAEARTEVNKNSEFCRQPGCSEPSVPGVGYCRIHREAAEA